ncbi:MAG: hypothetical protein ACTSPY_02445 [Candidatus Helarchaeota archaeon]
MTENDNNEKLDPMIEVMKIYPTIPNIFYPHNEEKFDRKLDLAFFSLFLENNGDENVLEKWCESTGTKADWNIESNFELDGYGNWYHPQISLIYTFIPAFYQFKSKKIIKRMINIQKRVFNRFIDHLKKLEMRKVKLTLHEYNKLLSLPIFPFYLAELKGNIKRKILQSLTDDEIFIFKILENEGRPLNSNEIFELINSGKYLYEKKIDIYKITNIRNGLKEKGLSWRQRFPSSLFKIKNIRIEFNIPILFFTRWHHNYFETSKRSYIYLKIPEYFNEKTFLGKPYKLYETLSGGMGFTFRDPKINWKITRKNLLEALNQIEYVKNNKRIETDYVVPLENLTYEHFLVGFYLEIAPTASLRDLIKVTGIYRQKLSKIISLLKENLLHPPQPFLRRFDLPNQIILNVKSNKIGIYNLLNDIGKLFPMYVLYRTFDFNDYEFNLLIYLPQNSIGITIFYLKKFFSEFNIKASTEIIKNQKFNNFIDIKDYFDNDEHDWILDIETQFKIYSINKDQNLI